MDDLLSDGKSVSRHVKVEAGRAVGLWGVFVSAVAPQLIWFFIVSVTDYRPWIQRIHSLDSQTWAS
jgi:hypothetical protein